MCIVACGDGGAGVPEASDTSPSAFGAPVASGAAPVDPGDTQGPPDRGPQGPSLATPDAGPGLGAPVDDAEDAAAPTDASQQGPSPSASADALAQLRAHLALPEPQRTPVGDQAFAAVALTASDAQLASEALWMDRAARIREARAQEHTQRRIELDGVVLRYETVVLGDAPAGGRDLFISMHGGGSGPASQNDQQWRNQVSLATGYAPEHALWIAPRAPTDDWNMWFKPHIDDLFDRLITNMIVFEGIDPNRVYVNGYSAGGDGVYGLSPRTADRWAGAGMSAGHPNGVSLDNLRNLAFAIHVGGDDSAFDRNKVGQEYIDKLAMLHAADPDGYVYQGMVHPGLPHWMNLADAVSIPFLQAHTRDPAAARVVWEQHEVTHTRSYWLAVDAADAQQGDRVVASRADQVITLEEATGVDRVRIRLRDDMLDLDQPIRVMQAGATLFEGRADRTIGTLARTLDEREDPAMMFSAELEVEVEVGN